MRFMRLKTSGTSGSASVNKSARDFMLFNLLANRSASIAASLDDEDDEIGDVRHGSETPRNSSTSLRNGRLGIAPNFVTAKAPAALANFMASRSLLFSAIATANAARNASPAAVASTSLAPAGSSIASTLVTSSPLTSNDPRLPSVHRTATRDVPATILAALTTASSPEETSSTRIPAIPASSLSFGAT